MADWNEYQLLVLEELKRHNNVLEALARDMGEVRVELAVFAEHSDRLALLEAASKVHSVEIATLKVKAGLWGGFAGIITAVAAALVHMLKG